MIESEGPGKIPGTPTAHGRDRPSRQNRRQVKADFVDQRAIKGLAKETRSSFHEDAEYSSATQLPQSRAQAESAKYNRAIPILVVKDPGLSREPAGSRPNNTLGLNNKRNSSHG
jgi:hypothetical protein